MDIALAHASGSATLGPAPCLVEAPAELRSFDKGFQQDLVIAVLGVSVIAKLPRCVCQDAGCEFATAVPEEDDEARGVDDEVETFPALLSCPCDTREDFTLIRRLLKAGEKVVMEMEIRNEVSRSPVTVHNTVAELVGGDLKDEIVFAGGHLDSWDLASGTTDNGTGSMVVMEAARILSSLKQKPRRTIRFILFTGEEQGLVGSREYAKAHEQEMPRYKAGLIMDIGTAKLVGLSMHGQEQLVPLFKSCLSAVEDLGLTDFNMRYQGGTDHLSFQVHGVPAFAFIHAKSEYNLTHHTQSDTYDKALKKDLKQAACVMATGLWELANVEGEIGRFDPEKAPRRGRGRGQRRRR